MKISTKREIVDWVKSVVFAVIIWTCFLGGLAASTKVHNWHLMQKNTWTAVAATEQAHK